MQGEGGSSSGGNGGDFDNERYDSQVNLCFQFGADIITVNADKSDRVGCLKEMLSEQIQVPCSMQKLFISGHEMTNNVTVESNPLMLKSSSRQPIHIIRFDSGCVDVTYKQNNGEVLPAQTVSVGTKTVKEVFDELRPAFEDLLSHPIGDPATVSHTQMGWDNLPYGAQSSEVCGEGMMTFVQAEGE